MLAMTRKNKFKFQMQTEKIGFTAADKMRAVFC